MLRDIIQPVESIGTYSKPSLKASDRFLRTVTKQNDV